MGMLRWKKRYGIHPGSGDCRGGSVYRDSDVTMCGDVCVIGKENKPFDQYPRNVSLRAIQYEGTGDCGSDADRAGI